MRILFVLTVLANVVMYGIGQGWFGLAPSEEGRDPGRFRAELNANRVTISP
ncbi:hypothetical protein [Achromobacter aloeverae]|uniref:hypothetical protein n=1 Tax=Achromobacter aloeverae TaxID=1750518 RepID=UPI001863C507|nr:hypothetical protein [Achromobacter aloeverae]